MAWAKREQQLRILSEFETNCIVFIVYIIDSTKFVTLKSIQVAIDLWWAVILSLIRLKGKQCRFECKSPQVSLSQLSVVFVQHQRRTVGCNMVLNIKVKPIDEQISIPSNMDLSPENLSYSFEWSLNPLVKWMSILGVPPPPIDGNPRWPYYFIRIFVVSVLIIVDFWLVGHIFLNASSVSGIFSNGPSTTALSWNLIVDGCNFSLYEIVGYGFLISLTRPKTWRNLITSTNKLDQHLPLPHIYPKCRRSLINLMIYVATSVLFIFNFFYNYWKPSNECFTFYGLQTFCLVSILTYDVFTNDSLLVRKVLDLSNTVLTYIPKINLVLFCFMTRLISLQLEAIQSALILERNDQSGQLKILQNQYLLVFEMFCEINQHFRFYLLIETSFTFIGVINASMYLVTSTMGGNNLLTIICIIVSMDHILRMFLITSCSKDIEDQVKYFSI